MFCNEVMNESQFNLSDVFLNVVVSPYVFVFVKAKHAFKAACWMTTRFSIRDWPAVSDHFCNFLKLTTWQSQPQPCVVIGQWSGVAANLLSFSAMSLTVNFEGV